MSKFASLFLILLLIMSGCVDKKNPVPDNNDFLNVSDPMPKPKGQSVLYPSTYDVVTVNPITINDHGIFGEGVVTGNYVKIDGLIDTAVEIKINNEVRNAVEAMSRYRDRDAAPAYRGIDARIPSTVGQAKSIVVYAYVSYNQNRIISVVINGFVHFEQGNQSYEYSVCEGLNFDLNTGNRLSLSDVLTNDTDIPKLLLPLIHQELGWTNDYETADDNQFLPAIVAPFTEIRGSQNFYLDESGIILVFDMNTPELDTKLQPFMIPLYYSELGTNNALAHRFDVDSAIFEYEVIEKRFFITETKNEIVSTTKLQEKNPMIQASTRYAEDLPAFYVGKVEADVQRIRPFIQNVLTTLPTIQRAYVYVSVSKIYKYTVISTYLSAYQLMEETHDGPDGEWNFDDMGPHDGVEIYEVYDETNRKLELKDVFVAGYDYESIVSYKLREALSMQQMDISKYLAPLLQNVTFRLASDGIELFADATIDGTLKTMRFAIPYREIRAKNLTIFD